MDLDSTESLLSNCFPRKKAAHFNLHGYLMNHMTLAEINFSKKNYNKTVYHLCECHGIFLRNLTSINEPKLKLEYISFLSDFFKDDISLLQQLSNMPSEWTVVQLTRCPLPTDLLTEPNSSPKLDNFFVSRLPCGSELKSGCLIPVYLKWPKNATADILDVFWKSKGNLGVVMSSMVQTTHTRLKSSNKMKDFIKEMSDFCFRQWKLLFLGRLFDSSLEKKIRQQIDKVLKPFNSEVDQRQRYLCYIFAEGCHHLSHPDVESAIKYLFPGNTLLTSSLTKEIKKIFDLYPNLKDTKRHPVILIVDEHLDIVPWECLTIIENHPVSRIASIHLLYAVFKLHEPHIKNGLREINSNDVSYYVINPGGDIPSNKLKLFFKKRLPTWVGKVDEIPTDEEWVTALTSSNTFIYCGHGSGRQYLQKIQILKLQIKSIQLLFGCSSIALQYCGGITLMSGESLNFLLAGSGCTIGMLYSVTSFDTDKMTMHLANIWLPGTPLDLDTLEEISDQNISEPELLRTLKSVRDVVNQFSNGAALIARGIPIKLV